ncbi:thioesterase domain-containing protein [Nocardia xishanensis]
MFCLPPMSGMSWTYAGLARFLPADQPIYGLQSPALTEPDYRPGTAAEIVRRYVTEIKAVQPEGPYRLLGWSVGGVLAHSVAIELQAGRDRVDLLAILDSARDVDIADFHAEIGEGFEALGITLPAEQDLAELDETAPATLGEALTWDSAVRTAERIGGIYRGALRTARSRRPPSLACSTGVSITSAPRFRTRTAGATAVRPRGSRTFRA